MPSPQGIYRYSAVLMGSPVLLALLSDNSPLAGRVFRLIKHYENLFTVNRASSEVMSVNRAAGLHPVVVSAPVFELIKCARTASLIEGSCFNLAIGPLVKRWRIGFCGDSVPPEHEIAGLLTRTQPRDVCLNASQRTVYLTKTGMELDLGAIAKGYIADRVRDYLRKEGVSEGLINLGGNVQTLGGPYGGWTIGLKKPFSDSEALIGHLRITDRSVVTSGTYERYFERDGRRYHHILDPRTGYPLDNELDSVTVIARHSLDCDIWTTLVYGMGIEKGREALRHRPDIEAIFVTKRREIICSSSRSFSFTLTDRKYRLV